MERGVLGWGRRRGSVFQVGLLEGKGVWGRGGSAGRVKNGLYVEILCVFCSLRLRFMIGVLR